MLGILLLTAGMSILDTQESSHHQPLIAWKNIAWNYPNESVKADYEATGKYSPTTNLPLGVNAWNDKLFITVPRWKKGVLATLNYVDLKTARNEGSPRLNPYPNWDSNDIRNEDAIVNILRVRIDECDRMWAVDSGVDDIWGEFKVVHPPKLIVIDLKTDKIIHTYTYKASDLTPNTFFADVTVDVDPKKCEDAYVYASDLGGFGLVVYSLAKNESWRVNHNYFYFDPLNGDYKVNGIKFQWTDGVIGLALSPRIGDDSRTLYFHAMSSTTEFSVPTKLLKDREALSDRHYYEKFQVVGDKGKNSQGTSMMLDPVTGIMYFTQLNKNALACWDTHVELNPTNFRIAAQDNSTMIFPNDIALDLKTRKLYLLADDLATFEYSKFNWNNNNFHVHEFSLDELAKVCKA